MEHFFVRCSEYLASASTRHDPGRLAQFGLLRISDSENSEDEGIGQNSAPTLETMRKELGAIGGAGHFFEDDREIWKGGVRDEVDGTKIRKVLKLLSLGERKVNLKGWGFFLYFTMRIDVKKAP